MNRLIPENLPEAQWIQFDGCGISEHVSGVVYRTGEEPCCGVPLGGISTGCIDIDARGVYGYSTVFHPSSGNQQRRMPRKLPRVEPILALAVGDEVWVLASPEIVTGGRIDWCTDPGMARIDGREVPQDSIALPRLEGVRAPEEIEYWGHYPVVDMEFTTDSPVQVGLRAWSPFIPGDAAASNIPAAVFEVHLINTSSQTQRGTIAFNFPGPDTHDALAGKFGRQIISEDFRGVLVTASAGVQYVAGIIGEEPIRVGGGLGIRPSAWGDIATGLPQPAFGQQGGHYLSDDASSAVAADFELEPGQSRVVRFLLTWYAPVWEGARNDMHLAGDGCNSLRTPWLGSKWAGEVNHYTEMYASRYDGAVDVARRMASEHEALLKRVLAWQEVVYAEDELPVWLRDSLVNSLALIAEDSHWAQAKAPLGDWCYPEGVFGLDESPRGCPHMACIPCDWYGNLPIVFFFPELALSTLRAFRQYQLDDGEIPFALGKGLDLPDFATPEYYWQVALNGTCYVDMVDRVWQRTGDRKVLEEFYDSVKACNTFTIDLNPGPGGVISMPAIGGMEWFEFGEWAGMATHMGGLRLAQLRIVERMAGAMSDEEYAEQCRQWLTSGSRAMEEEMWAGDYYLNFWDKQTGKKSEAVMGYQLDGQWMAVFHGLPGVFRGDRVKRALETIRECNIALTPEVGAANFVNRDGTPLTGDSAVAKYGQYAMFSAEVLVLAMTYIHAGEDEFGLDLARRYWENLICRQLHPWDLPAIVRGDTGERVTGTDYYQNMMLWALPAAIAGQDIMSYCASGGLVDRILAAGSPD